MAQKLIKILLIICVFTAVNIIFLTTLCGFNWIVGFMLFMLGVIGKTTPESFFRIVLISELFISLILSYFVTMAYWNVALINRK
jgi:hypothetical protein